MITRYKGGQRANCVLNSVFTALYDFLLADSATLPQGKGAKVNTLEQKSTPGETVMRKKI